MLTVLINPNRRSVTKTIFNHDKVRGPADLSRKPRQERELSKPYTLTRHWTRANRKAKDLPGLRVSRKVIQCRRMGLFRRAAAEENAGYYTQNWPKRARHFRHNHDPA
jgi:hypothetical protein